MYPKTYFDSTFLHAMSPLRYAYKRAVQHASSTNKYPLAMSISGTVKRMKMFDTAKSMLAGQIWTSLYMVCGCVHTQNRAVKCAGRKPMLLLRFVGVLLLRLAERRLFGLLFQFPPRITRLELGLPSLPVLYHLVAKLHSITAISKRTQCFQ